MRIYLSRIIIAIFSIFALVSLQSCQHDSCVDLNCQNGGTCVDDHCKCPTGFEGPECRTFSNQKFIGMWVGTSKCNDGTTSFPLTIDTVEIFTECNPNQIRMIAGLGATSMRTMIGTAATPEAEFMSHDDGTIHVNPYVRVDDNQLMVTLVSINKLHDLRYICDFEGRRVEGTDTLATYTTPMGAGCL